MIGIEEFISKNLVGGLWHTTSVGRFEAICTAGFIKVEPDLPEQERYNGMPFVRSLGGVSLFDFPQGFDLAAYEADIPTSSLGEFIPFKRAWGRSVWLKIDAELTALNVRSGKEIRAQWRAMGSTKRFMAEVEAAHLGDIPYQAIREAYVIGEGDAEWTCIWVRSWLTSKLSCRHFM